jgi:hypothetical protein
MTNSSSSSSLASGSSSCFSEGGVAWQPPSIRGGGWGQHGRERSRLFVSFRDSEVTVLCEVLYADLKIEEFRKSLGSLRSCTRRWPSENLVRRRERERERERERDLKGL